MARILPYRLGDLRSLCGAVAGVIGRHGVIGIPTETYYGLGVNPRDASALQRVAAVKGRPQGKPILVLIGAREQLQALIAPGAAGSPVATLLIQRFWPGPLTIVFPAREDLPVELTAGTGTVGVRWTSCDVLARILQEVGPLTGTSANRSGASPVRTAEEVARALGDELDLIIDGGPTAGAAPSTVVDLQDTGARVLREGAIPSSVLERTLSKEGFHLKSCEM
jgi:L-threonylcarbamoyladenylate synthase